MISLRWKSGIYPKLRLAIQALFMMCWLSSLRDTDSFYSIYVLCGFAGLLGLYDNCRHHRMLPEKGIISCLVFAAMFSGATVLANYRIFIQVRDVQEISYDTGRLLNLFNGICSLIGGTLTAWHFLVSLLSRFPLTLKAGEDTREHPRKIFWAALGSIAAIDLIYLFVCQYPGNLSPDSINQIAQCYTGVYVNNHPFWHTMLINVVLSAGFAIFGSANGAVAFFGVCQLLFMAACFAYALVTLYQAGIPKWFIAACWCVYALVPYHIAYSVTMWKDVVFGGAAVLIAASLFRILRKIDRKQLWNYVIFVLGSMGLCLWRTNGMVAYAMSALIFVPYLWKRQKKLAHIILVVILVGGLLTGPVISALGVEGTDSVEAFSISLQQMARVVAEDCPLTEEENALLSRIFDMEEMAEVYTHWLADPVKNEVRENDVEYFKAHLGEYIRLWLRLGRKYPGVYMKAWVDQTRGYWNGGYFYYTYSEMMYENPFGLVKTGGGSLLARLVDMYFTFVNYCVFAEPVMSIGLQVWIVAICCFLNLRKKREEFLLCIPGLAIVIGLLVGTPVFSEFRYAYPLVTACPLILGVTLWDTENRVL